MPATRIVCENEVALADELRRLDGGLGGFGQDSKKESDGRPHPIHCESCKQDTCGPDLTAAVIQVLAAIKAAYARWYQARDWDRVEGACDAISSPTPSVKSPSGELDKEGKDPGKDVPVAAIAWDMIQLYDKRWLEDYYSAGCAGTEKCFETIAINGQCHYAGSVNYAIFGAMCRLCMFTELTMNGLIWAYRAIAGTIVTGWCGRLAG